MLLSFNFEEVTALSHGARSFLEDAPATAASVAATTAVREAVERAVVPITGDLTVNTLLEQEELERGVAAVVAHLRSTMDQSVLMHHAAAEEAVAAYFDYAHTLSVLGRIRIMGSEMRALLELITGTEPSRELAGSFVFPD